MSVSVKFEKPSRESITHIAENMRVADIAEVWSMSRHTPADAIERGLNISQHSSVVMVDDEPCAVLGLVQLDMLTGTGVPWLLGTDHAVKHRRTFLKYSKCGIEQMLSICPQLFNYVHADNEVSVNWLQHMGFTIDNPEPMGRDCELFHRFHIGY